MRWDDRLRAHAILTRSSDFDVLYHVSLDPAVPDEYHVPGIVALTFRLRERPWGGWLYVLTLDPAAALRLGERLGLDAAEALAMVDSHERVHIELQLAGVSEAAEEDASRHVDAVWLSLRHPRAAHLVEDREVAIVTRVGPGFWEALLLPEG